jgi:hypothetical protein
VHAPRVVDACRFVRNRVLLRTAVEGTCRMTRRGEANDSDFNAWPDEVPPLILIDVFFFSKLGKLKLLNSSCFVGKPKNKYQYSLKD